MAQQPDTQVFEGRRAARLAAVQANYQLELDPQLTPDLVLMQFLTHRQRDEVEHTMLVNIDKAFFTALVEGVQREMEDLDMMLTGAMPPDWTVPRLDSVLRAILRTGTYELANDLNVPAPVSLNEYVGLAKEFFTGPEPKVTNGVLNTLAETLRPDEVKKPG